MPALLTKSALLSAVQCPRKLWLEVRRPDISVDEDAAAERRKREGIQVGELARKQMGPTIIWPKSQVSKEASALKAKELLIADPEAPAVEFPLYFDDVYARADALIPEGDGSYVLRETKATTFPLKKDKVTPDKPDVEHVIDVAIQAYVMQQSGVPMARAELNLINSKWKYPGGGDYSGLFRIMDITPEVNEILPHIPIRIAASREIIEGQMPDMETGKHCKDPHGCQYLEFCKKIDPPKPAHPIELLPDSAGKKLAAKLRYEKGYVSLLEPKPIELTGKAHPLYVRMQTAHRLGVPHLEPTSGAELALLPYPRYYFDFEGIDLAIPIWEGVRPYEQIPFQWSCHIETSPGVFEHGEFLDLTGNDPSLGCIEKMLEIIDVNGNGPIFVYFATYEKGRLQELALRHPEFESEMARYVDRLVDLLPMVKDNFYHPDMKGSFSIKKVLPVIAPDMDYGELEEVKDGTGAQIAYIKAAVLNEFTPEGKAETEKNSRIYCRQDTWAMVEVAYFLAQQPRPLRPDNM
jgi:CRISPR/Cas system-associated exonuclease Cas4 (RecB family)